MSNHMVKWLVFAVLIGLNFWVPASMIYRQARTEEAGTLVKFRTMPVDPYDPFRGRYVRLRFDSQSVALADPEKQPVRGQRVFARVEVDSSGFGRFGEALLEEPNEGLYVTAEAGYGRGDGTVNLRLPFERYYMNERVAPKAERAYAEANRIERGVVGADQSFSDENYAAVRILNGNTAIDGVFLENTPIEEYARENDLSE